jgi:hypothetical protein
MSSEWDFGDELIERQRLEKFQRMLATLVLAAKPTGSLYQNPVYLAQFDDASAW